MNSEYRFGLASALQSRSDIDIYDFYLAALHDLTPLYISRIFNSFRSAAVTFDHAFITSFLRFNLGIPNDIRTY
jgi:hypothetical protein